MRKGASLATEHESAPSMERNAITVTCLVEQWASVQQSLPVERIPIAAIEDSYSPRQGKPDQNHIKALAESPTTLPPIVIHHNSMRVIDGAHRLQAARLRGQESIAARLFDGTDADAFALAVHLNVSHGLPLTLCERRAAAQHVLACNPEWSDRSIALIAGLSNKTVAKLRARAIREGAQLNERVGRDGRIRPVSAADGRRRAAEFMARNPRASLRETAKHAGVSVGTARDVRMRLERGNSALPESLTNTCGTTSHPTPDAIPVPADLSNGNRQSAPESHAKRSDRAPVPPGVHRHGLLQRLKNDPAVRSSERGRTLLRLLTTTATAIGACHEFADTMPAHCAGTVAELAKRNALAWQEIETKFRTL